MQERKRGDITGSQHGELSGEGGFTDWDNPEDDEEDAPEGYYDEEDDDDSYVPGPDDPDYDLSEAAGYSNWEAPGRRGIIPQWIIIVASLLLILAILTPVILQFD